MDPGNPFDMLLPVSYDMSSSLPENADASKGTDVVMPNGTTQHFDAGQQPKIFIGDEFDGGWAAAAPGTPEYDHYSNLQKRSNEQGYAKVGLLIGGAALAGGFLNAGGAFNSAGAVTSDVSTYAAPGAVQGANATQGFATDLLPGAGVTAPTTGIPSTIGGQALAGAGLPADLGGAGSFATLTPATLAPGGGVLAGAAAPAVSAGTGLAPAAAESSAGSNAANLIRGDMTLTPAQVASQLPADLANAAGAGTGFLGKVGSLVKDNKDLIGSVLDGVGKGLALDAENKAQLDLLQKKHDLIASNYNGANPSSTFRGLAPNTGAPSPAQRFGASTAGVGGWRWEYDPSQGKIVKVADQHVPLQPTPQQAV